MFTTISWYTKDIEYDNVMNRYFYPSIEKLDIPYKIYPMDSVGNWMKNTNLKPVVIEKALEELDTNLLIVDADAVIHSFPKLMLEIPKDYDCAMFWLDWNEWYQNGSDIKELCSGTLYIRNRLICKELIKTWIMMSKLHNLTDQKVLEKALHAFPDLKIYKLPYEYLWINSLPNNKVPFVKRPKNVIIEHFQISRSLKRKL